MVLRRHQNQSCPCFGGPWLRCRAAGLQDANDRGVGRDDANPDRSDHGKAENQRHEERNQDQPPYPELDDKIAAAGAHLEFRQCGFFNLPALTLAAIDD